MSEPDGDTIRHALAIARRHGFAEVVIETPETSFEAKLEPATRAKTWMDGAPISGLEDLEPRDGEITSTLVGYYQPCSPPVTKGSKVRRGDIVATIAALGLATDIESPFEGEVAEILVSEGQAVEYGQVLAKVKVEA